MSGSDPINPPIFVAQKAASANSFLDSIGINGEAKAATASMLFYLGINHLRTATSTASSLLAAGAGGAKIDVIVPWFMHAITTSDLKSFLTKIDPAASVIEVIEGPNEVNRIPDSFEGLTGVAGMQAEQKQIYALVKADTALNNTIRSTLVYSFTVLQGTPASTYGDLSADADVVNMHAYGGPGISPSWVLPYETARYRVADKPLVMTETGATTIATTGGVSEVMQARFDIKALLDAYSLNVSRTYLYDLQDWAPTSSTDNFSAHYGLYNIDGGIKLAGTAIHNLTTVLSQTPPGAVGTGSLLSYSLSGLPYYGQTKLFAKAGGVFDLAIWNETTDWNATTRSEVAIPTNHITLTLTDVFESIAVYDPLISANPIAFISNANSITLDLNDDPLIIELTPMGTAARTAAFHYIPDAPVISGISIGNQASAFDSNQVTSNPKPTLRGTALAGATVTVYDGSAVLGTALANNNGVWLLPVGAALAQGSHSFIAVASITAGNSTASTSYALVVDSIAPVVSSIVASIASGTTIHPGQTISFTLAFTKPILLDTSKGFPTLTLSTGIAAIFDPAHSTTTTLVFNTIILSGQTSSNLAATTLALNGAAITDQAGNTLSSLDLSSLAGSNFGIAIDPSPLPVTLGAGPDTITLGISEVGWQGDAQFGIKVDGIQIGGTQIATAIHGIGSQIYTLNGNFGQGSHKVSINLLNAGDAPHARQLYIDTITVGGSTAAFSSAISDNYTSLTYDSPIVWRPSTPVSLGAGPDTIIVNLSENAWKGDAKVTIRVDGVQIGGIQTVTAEHGAGQSQAFFLNGNFGPGTHTVAVAETNWDTGGTALLTRNVTLDSVTANNTTTIVNTLLAPAVPTNVNATLPARANVPSATVGTGPDSIKVGVSEDGFQGDVQFAISVDGVQVGGAQTTQAQHSAGQSQIFTLNGNFGQGSHKVTVTLLNWAWDNTYVRKLYVDSVAGTSTTNSVTGSLSAANTSLTYDSPIVWRPSTPVSLGAGPDTIIVNLSENAWKGDAKVTIRVDGVQIGGIQTVTAEHGAGQSQAFFLNGNFGPGTHTVAVAETNWDTGGTALLTRNVTLDSVTANNTTTIVNTLLAPAVPTNVNATLPARANVPSATVGTGPDSIKVGVSEDGFQGDVQFAISVDGVQVGGAQTTQAQHSAGQSQIFTLNGNFGQGSHKVTVTLLNWAWDNTYVRKLYVDSVAGTSTTNSVTGSLSAANTSLTYDSPIVWHPSPPVSLGAGPDTIIVNLSENAWKGDAQAIIRVDGVQIGGVQTVNAERSAGQSQAFVLNGNFGPGTHTVAVTETNYANGGTSLLSRNINVDSVTANGITRAVNTTLVSNLTKTVSVVLPATNAMASTATRFAWSDSTATISGTVSGDAYSGPVNYLQYQYIWSGSDGRSITAGVDNVFLHGADGNDTLVAHGGSNVLDGGRGSNVLIGGTGMDGGTDVFFTDMRDTGIVRNTIVNFHQGDCATIWGFHADVSTFTWAQSDGPGGYGGATVFIETKGAGSGVNASITFAGIGMDKVAGLSTTTGRIDSNDYFVVRL